MKEEQKEIKVNIPDGYEIDKEKSTFEYIVFKKKKTEIILPKTWEEFCEKNKIKDEECFIDKDSEIVVCFPTERDEIEDRTLLPDKKTAKAMLALCQLIQLRNCYNNGWKPDWKDMGNSKYVILCDFGEIARASYTTTSHILYFKTEELRDQFLEYFRNLIEIAKPLL